MGKGKKGTRLTWARLLPFILTTYADQLPPKKRTQATIRLLETLREVTRDSDGTTSHTILYPLAAAREAERMGRTTGLTPEEMLGALDWLLNDLPEEQRPRTRRALLEHFRYAVEQEGFPVPEWVRVGQERYGRWGDGPGEVPGLPPEPKDV